MNNARKFAVTAWICLKIPPRCGLCQIIGGISMAAYGMVHNTLDVRLVTTGEAQRELIAFLESEGYQTIH